MYTIKKVTQRNLTDIDLDFIRKSADYLVKKLGRKYQWENFEILRFIREDHLWMCYRKEEPIGFLAATLYQNFFDSETLTLKQNLMFSLSNTKGAYLLFNEFVDFGKAHANHIVTAIGRETNIKPSSLEKLGFTKLEELYRLEISK